MSAREQHLRRVGSMGPATPAGTSFLLSEGGSEGDSPPTKLRSTLFQRIGTTPSLRAPPESVSTATDGDISKDELSYALRVQRELGLSDEDRGRSVDLTMYMDMGQCFVQCVFRVVALPRSAPRRGDRCLVPWRSVGCRGGLRVLGYAHPQPPPSPCSPYTPAPTVFSLFKNQGIRHLAVLSNHGHLKGIITRHDLIVRDVRKSVFSAVKSKMMAKMGQGFG